MANRVPLDNVEHHGLTVAMRFGEQFGDAVNQTLVVPTEFEQAQREYPILFRRDLEGNLRSIAILGFDPGENLFLEGERWAARYVPAIHRRGPFSLAIRDSEGAGEPALEPAIHVDLDDARVGADGDPLFREHGGNAPPLDRAGNALQTLRDGLQVEGAMFATLEALGLIEAVSFDFELEDGSRYRFPELFTVSAERFAGLDGPKLEQLNRSGFLAVAVYARSSLGNLARLVELKNRKATA